MVLRELHGLWSTLHCCLSLAAWVWMRWRCRCCLLPLVLLSIAARRADAVPGTRSIFDPANTQPIRAMSQRLVYFAWHVILFAPFQTSLSCFLTSISPTATRLKQQHTRPTRARDAGPPRQPLLSHCDNSVLIFVSLKLLHDRSAKSRTGPIASDAPPIASSLLSEHWFHIAHIHQSNMVKSDRPLQIRLTEPVIFLRGPSTGLDFRGRPQVVRQDGQPAMLRGLLTLRLTKPTRIRSIIVRLDGRARTEWPEGACMATYNILAPSCVTSSPRARAVALISTIALTRNVP
jgi:hypothetical protein